jgi:hypothetical protein
MGIGKALVGLAGAVIVTDVLFRVTKKARMKLNKSKIKFI